MLPQTEPDSFLIRSPGREFPIVPTPLTRYGATPNPQCSVGSCSTKETLKENQGPHDMAPTSGYNSFKV